MRLFGKVSGGIDRYDRAMYLTPPFDRPFSAEGFRLYVFPALTLLATIHPDARSLDLDGLITTPGRYTLGLTRVDRYGNESEPEDATIEIRVGSGGTVNGDLLDPSNLTVIALAGGLVELSWHASNDGTSIDPAEWEIADASDAGTILETIDAGPRAFTVQLGPFTNGGTVRLLVRSSDGVALPGGKRSDWAAADPVVADSEAPPVPTVIDY